MIQRYKEVILRAGILLIAAFGFSHCKKFVQIGPPTTQLVTASVFNNDAAATAGQLAIYTQMASNTESLSLGRNTGLLGDELKNYSTSTSYTQYYTNAMTAAKTSGPWVDAYKYIYEANAMIEGLQNNGAISPMVQQQLTGEAKFIRAFWHFYLTSLYGDVPLLTTTEYTVNDRAFRTPKTQIYQQMISDLKDAVNLLNSNYVDATDTAVTTERTRPTKWAAAALLARVYLFSGDYSDAVAQATSVINNNSLYRLLGLQNDSVFLANSMEAIWQLAVPQPSPYDTPDGYSFILTSTPSGSSRNSSISPQLLQSFEPGDSRRINWVDSLIEGTRTYYFPYKYKINTIGTSEYTMVLRLAEQYLIRAEAEVQLNNLAAGAADLNVIRTRAWLPNISDSIANSQQALLTAIIHERQVELFTEWGQRWIDLGRSGIGNAVMATVAPTKGATWNPDGYQLLFPIPLSEITVDANLTQNNGY